MKEQEVTLTEAELSDVKNSIATLCKKYIAGSFFDKLVDSSGIKIAKDILMSDLKEMIGHGTSAPAAKKFANAIEMAKSTPAVDTILANYMLKGDGMGAGIGYNESAQPTDHIEAFRQFLSEARKAEKIDGKPSQEMIDEAIKTVEAEGYKVNKIAEKSASREVITQDQIDEAIEVAKKHGYRVITHEQLDEKKGCCGGKKIQKKPIKESADDRRIDFFCNDICDATGFKTLIDNAIATGNVDRESADAINDIEVDGDHVIVYCDRSVYAEDLIADLQDGISTFMDTAVGIEAEVGEDVVDRWEQLFDNIGYNESTAVPVQSFKQFLSEARKADKFDGKPSQEMINEAIEVAKANGYKVITPEMIEEAKKVVESKGFKVVNENDEQHEPKKDVLFIRLYDYDPDEVADLINAALEDKSVPTYLRNIFKNGAKVRKDYVCIDLGTYEEADEEETIQNLIKLVDAYTENAVGLEAEYGEELLDNYPFLFKKAYISNL